MKKKDVQVGKTYLAYVSGQLSRVKITGESPYGGWNGINERTGREVRIVGCARLRMEIKPWDTVGK